MDTKSLARSKRAHSQHLNKKHNPNPKSKPITTKTSDPNAKKKPSGKQIASNWDRYEEEEETDSTLLINRDVVMPKSKGADFAHLISQAQSKISQTSFDDVLPDYQGISSMLSVRGNGMLSWIGNDNFIVDDSPVTSDEASFFSLDLHCLASRLENIDVSRRLFIEADLLPSPLEEQGPKETTNPEPDHATFASRVAEQCLNEFAVLGQSSEEKSVRHSSMVMLSTATRCYSSLPDPHQGTRLKDQDRETVPPTRTGTSVQSFSSEGTSRVNPVKDDSVQIENFFWGEVGSIARSNADIFDVPKEEKILTFEALAAEEELDMLLNSFGEIKFQEPSATSKKPANNLARAHWDDSTTRSKENTCNQPFVQGSNLSRSLPANVGIDDTIEEKDALLRPVSMHSLPLLGFETILVGESANETIVYACYRVCI